MIFPGFPGVLSFFQVFQVFQVEWEPCLQLTFNDWLIIIDCQILLQQQWVHSQCQMCRYFPNAGCPVTFPTPDVQILFPIPAILVFLPALGN